MAEGGGGALRDAVTCLHPVCVRGAGLAVCRFGGVLVVDRRGAGGGGGEEEGKHKLRCVGWGVLVLGDLLVRSAEGFGAVLGGERAGCSPAL